MTSVENGVRDKVDIPLSQQEKTTDAIKRVAENIEGVKEVHVYATQLLGVD